ncbi:GGDEF domain-containing protein [Allorhizobium sp. BGMRC 0089]|uniref:GGDEF domain-containing protein n=1 Tax=Allorhizobium sonneratiae TaxID=2934936 RepID=UPI002034A54D|nr:GGDEF domain-containing protein [Allorhizobium sonneratiae]MCM2293676.1 GGDEF domain-containing protein [Allorhizobium sonneratiae]
MNSASTNRGQNGDLAAQILFAMRNMGVSPLPRNYELFYEAYIGSNPALTRRLVALGAKATQEDLDIISEEFFSHNSNRLVENAHSRLTNELDNIVRLLKQEQSALRIYSDLLEETNGRINAKNLASVELVRNAITLLSQATGDTMARGEKTVASFNQKSADMDAVRRELDEYKRIANTDSLTRLSNRRAFDERMANLFNQTPSASIALILIDIDHFKTVNDTFGHPVGDKILAIVAGLIRACLSRETFAARTGGEEFAVIAEGSSEDMQAMCEKIRSSIEATPFRNSRTGVNYGPITVSLGYAFAVNCQDASELYGRSDVALYNAKNSGRNCIRAYNEEIQREPTKSWLIYKGQG